MDFRLDGNYDQIIVEEDYNESTGETIITVSKLDMTDEEHPAIVRTPVTKYTAKHDGGTVVIKDLDNKKQITVDIGDTATLAALYMALGGIFEEGWYKISETTGRTKIKREIL